MDTDAGLTIEEALDAAKETGNSVEVQRGDSLVRVEPSGAIIEINADTAPPTTAGDKFFDAFGKQSEVLHNFGGDAQEVWAMTARATGPTCKNAEEATNKKIILRWYYAHAVEIVRDDGEIDDGTPRIVLIDVNKVGYSFVSRSIMDGLRQLLQSFGGKLPDDGVPIAIKRVQTRRGRNIFAIEPWVDDAETEG